MYAAEEAEKAKILQEEEKQRKERLKEHHKKEKEAKGKGKKRKAGEEGCDGNDADIEEDESEDEEAEANEGLVTKVLCKASTSEAVSPTCRVTDCIEVLFEETNKAALLNFRGAHGLK